MQFHYPGYEFMGPGTHIINKIQNFVQPVNRNDFLSMLHDIQYLQTAGDDPSWADKLAIVQSDNSLSGLALKSGLLTRYSFGLNFNKPLKD